MPAIRLWWCDISWEEEIKYNPGLWKHIDDYHLNLREMKRRKDMEKWPCQMPTSARWVSMWHRLDEGQEGLLQNGLMSLEVALNIVRPKIGHNAFSQRMVETRTWSLSNGLSTHEACISIVSCYCYSSEDFLRQEDRETNLCNHINDQFMSNCLICYVGKEEMMKVTNEAVVSPFMKM